MQKTDASFLNPYQSAYFSIRLANIFKLTWIYKYALFPFYICISIYRLFSCCADRYTLLDKAESTIYASPQVFHSPEHVQLTERFVKTRFRKKYDNHLSCSVKEYPMKEETKKTKIQGHNVIFQKSSISCVVL